MFTGSKYQFIAAVILFLGLLPQQQDSGQTITLNFTPSAYAANKPPPPRIKKPKTQKKAPAKKPSFKNKPQKKKAIKKNKPSQKKSLKPKTSNAGKKTSSSPKKSLNPNKTPSSQKNSLKPKKAKQKKSLNQQKTSASTLRPKTKNIVQNSPKSGSLKSKFNNGGYPPNNGFKGNPRKIFLRAGTKIDRYGSGKGNFSSPLGTKFDKRSLPPGSEKLPYRAYVVKKPFPVTAGKAAAWFGKPGGGTQYMSKKSIDKLVKDGYLVELKDKRRR